MKLIRLAVADALRAARVAHDARLNQASTSSYSRTNTALCALAASMTLSGAAWAQQAPADTTSAGNQSLDEVTVTGSRIRRTTDFDTANPTTVVDESFLKNLGIVNVGDAVAQLPSNVSNNTPATTG